jgi:hypothetical protein
MAAGEEILYSKRFNSTLAQQVKNSRLKKGRKKLF